jgi:hypothetical protein
MVGFKKFDPHAFVEEEARGAATEKVIYAGGALGALATFSPTFVDFKKPDIQNKTKTRSFDAPSFQKNANVDRKVAKAPKVVISNRLPCSIEDAFSALERRCPDHVEPDRWRRAVEDGKQFLDKWDVSAAALGWNAEELFGLHIPPPHPHPFYNRLARYDCTGLIWLLESKSVIALTKTTADIQHGSGAITVYRKERKPALGPIGDSLDDFV